MPDARRRQPSHRTVRFLALAALSVLAACDKGTCTFLGAPPFVVPRIDQGSAVTYPFSAIARSGGVSGGDLVASVVDFSLNEVTAAALSVTPNPLEIESTRDGQVTFHAMRDANPGVYTVTAVCRPKGESSGEGSANFVVEVDEATFFTLAASPTSLTLDPGELGTARIDIVRDAGFTDPVTFAVSGVPAGAAVGMNTGPTAGTSTGLSFSAGTAAPGMYTLTITGTSAGRTRTATIDVEIVAPVIPVDWTISATPVTVTIPSGTTGQVTVSLTRTNFPHSVQFFVDFLPPTFPIEFAPEVTTGNTTVLTITVPPLTPVGPMPFEIYALANDAASPNSERRVAVLLMIAPPVQ